MGSAGQVSQRAYKSLADLLFLVCASYFTTKLSKHIIDKVLGVEQPHYRRYIVCPNTSCRRLYDWCTMCGRTWPYVASPPACNCVSDVLSDAAESSPPPSGESPQDRRKRLGQLCVWIAYPGHLRDRPGLGGRCNTWLFKEAARDAAEEVDDGKKRKKKQKKSAEEPQLVYCYRPLSKRLAQLLCRPGVEDMCEEWRTRVANTPAGLMTDIINGRMWQKFQSVRDPKTGQRHPFLSEPYNFAFTINCDWFQPFKHVVYPLVWCI